LRNDFANREPSIDVRTEDGANAVKRTAREYRAGPLADFFCRLQHNPHITFGGVAREKECGADGPRRVDVVAAGVHHTQCLRGEIESGGFGDRQRVDITAERDDRRGTIASRNRDDEAGVRDANNLATGAIAQDGFETFLRRGLVPREFRVGMQRAPQSDELGAFVRGEEGVDAHARRTSVRTVSAATRSTSTATPIPGESSGTRTSPSALIVHSGVTTSCVQ
jgi:hypothetical protein